MLDEGQTPGFFNRFRFINKLPYVWRATKVDKCRANITAYFGTEILIREESMRGLILYSIIEEISPYYITADSTNNLKHGFSKLLRECVKIKIFIKNYAN